MHDLLFGGIVGSVVAAVAILLGRRKCARLAATPKDVSEVVDQQTEDAVELIDEQHAKTVRKLDSRHAVIKSANISEIVDILNSEFSHEDVLDD